MKFLDILSSIIPYLGNAPVTIFIFWIGYIAVSKKYLREMSKMKSEIEKISIENKKLLTEIQQINFNIAKEKMDKAILFSKMKKDFLISLSEITFKLKNFTVKISTSRKNYLKNLRADIDLLIFRNVILTLNEISMCMDYFWEQDFQRRNDFIIDTIIPSLEILQLYFPTMNDDFVLEKTDSEKSILKAYDLQSINRFLINSKDNDSKTTATKMIQNLLAV